MDIQRGLSRLSAIWWGFWMLLAALVMVVVPFTRDTDKWLIVGFALGGLAAAYAGHKLTCWVLAGFFGSTPRT